MPQQQPLARVPIWGPGQAFSPWNAPYSSAHISAVFSGDVALPLGDHLLLVMRDKILCGDFVDLFSWLFREIKKKDKDLMDEKEKEILKSHRVDHTWANWLPGFLVYARMTAMA